MKTIKQKYLIKAPVEEIYLALTNPLTIELWSGYPAKMEAVEGSEFSIFEGDICGRNLKIIPEQLLVQEWYFGETNEPSIVTISLKSEKNKTYVELEHTNVPDEVYDDFVSGWKEYYWGAIMDYFK